MSAPSAPLTAFEVAVGSRRAPLARLKNVRVHSETHATARLSPVKPGLFEDQIEPFSLRLLFDWLRAGHNHRAQTRRNLFALDHAGGRPKVFDARVRARAYEHAIKFYFLNR